MEELKQCIKNLDYKKAVGPDGIANAFLKHATDELLGILLKFLNLNIKHGMVSSNWCQDFITLIHKEGPKHNPGNYRGLCIMNSLLKLLCSMLNERLTLYCNTRNLINKEQIGFQKNSRTPDHILTLKAIVNKYVTDKEGKKLYTCFIDIKNAFDSVWHDGLFRKVENIGINGNILDLIKSIYKKTKCAVKINKTTKYFEYQKGVQQGNPLSPLLFNLYINDLFKNIISKNPISLDNTNHFNALMYADDLIILSTSKEGLQPNLNALNDYCKKWKLDINYVKTKCLTFTNGTQKEKHNFTLNSETIENVKEYKYLRITINSKKCSFIPTLADLGCKGKRALYAIISKIPLKLFPIKTMLKLFDVCITPILLYGSEIWRAYTNIDHNKWESTPIEKLHTQLIKRILGVNRSTTNILVRGEIGRHSL